MSLTSAQLADLGARSKFDEKKWYRYVNELQAQITELTIRVLELEQQMKASKP